MPYSCDGDLQLEFTPYELAQLTGDPSGIVIDYARIDNCRVNADCVINAYLHNRYEVPFQPPIDPVIRKIAVDLTIANLYEAAYQKTSLPPTVLWRRVNSVKLLKDLQQGYASLISAHEGANSPPAIISNKTSDDRMFTGKVLDGI